MKISFCMIVFNAIDSLPRDMLFSNIKRLMPYAHDMVIVEGATHAFTGNWDGDTTGMTKDGWSTDGTRALLLNSYKLPHWENKVNLVLASEFWDGKTSMCRKWQELATGDYMWQIDADEFYREEDIVRVIKMLEEHPYEEVHFKAHHFWGDFHHKVSKETDHLWGNDIPWKRIFKKHDRGEWRLHEPPTYFPTCESSDICTRDMTNAMGINLFHYSMVSRQQAEFKSKFFRNPDYLKMFDAWQYNHEIPLIRGTRTERFNGEHPEVIHKLYL